METCFGIGPYFDLFKLHIDCFDIANMSIPIHQLTMEQAHKEFNSLVDDISAKFEQLDSRELVE